MQCDLGILWFTRHNINAPHGEWKVRQETVPKTSDTKIYKQWKRCSFFTECNENKNLHF